MEAIMARIKERLAVDGTKRYTAEIRLKGYPPQSNTFDRLTDAKKWVQKIESDMRADRFDDTSQSRKHTLGEAITAYTKTSEFLQTKKAKEQIQQLAWWNEQLGCKTLAAITTEVIETCSEQLLTEPNTRGKLRSPATVFQYMCALSRLFEKYAIKKKWATKNPVKNSDKPSIKNDRTRYLSEAERASLLTECEQSESKYLHTCVVLAISTGMRKSELMNLKWSDVSLRDGFLILHETKNGERRRVTLSGYALELLNEQAKQQNNAGLLFPSKNNPNQPIDLRSPWENALRRANITNFHWHDLRHSTASYLAMNGASLVEIAEILGHKTLAVTHRYAHLSDGHVSNVVSSMNENIFGEHLRKQHKITLS